MYDSGKYQLEKANGVRAPSGALNLSRLTGKHRRIILLHVNGMKGYDIAKEMAMSPTRISNILCDPMVREEIKRMHEELDGELFSKSVQVVGASLEDEDHALRLRAADMIWKANGRYAEKAPTTASAEDIVQRMLSLAAEGHSASLTISTAAPAAPDGGLNGAEGAREPAAPSPIPVTIEGEKPNDL